MKILGIDPGFQRCGYGIINVEQGRFEALTYGLITTDPKSEITDRLLKVAQEIESLVKKHQPETAAIEQLFFEKNKKTFMRVSQAQGGIIVTLKKLGLDVAEYTPLQVKKLLTSYGQASKNQVQFMVEKILKIEQRIKIDDTADALAIAICHGLNCQNNYPKIKP